MAGRILKVKLGYNPNSSSIGSLFSEFLWMASAGSFLLAMFADLRPRKGDDGDGATDEAATERGEPHA